MRDSASEPRTPAAPTMSDDGGKHVPRPGVDPEHGKDPIAWAAFYFRPGMFKLL